MKVLRKYYKAILFGKVLLLSNIFTKIFKMRLRLNEVVFGRNLKCYNAIPKLQINRLGSVRIGNNVVFNSFTDHSWNSCCKLIVLANAELCIGDNSGFNGVMVFCSNRVVVKDNVKIGGGTRISDSNHHSLDYILRRDSKRDGQFAKNAPVVIGNDVFIGANCYIGKGVSIGDRSIVAAGSVVVKSIPSDEIWGGNPAMFIRKL